MTKLRDLPAAERFAMTAGGRICLTSAGGEVYCKWPYYTLDERYRAADKQHGLSEPRLLKLGIGKAQDIVAGEEHFCALGVDGTVTCWDENGTGQCGAPTEGCVEVVYGGCKVGPQRVALNGAATAIAAGARHSCAVVEGGGVACWGDNNYAALGFRSNEVCHPYWRGFCDATPHMVSGVEDVVELSARRAGVQTWALTENGRVLVWPAPNATQADTRPLAGSCRQTEGTLSSDEIIERESDFLGRRVRVRGSPSVMRIAHESRLAFGKLLLHPSLQFEPRPGEEIIVDGKVTRFISTLEEPAILGIYVYDICRVPRRP